MAELHNPMVPGFNPDPSVVRVDGAYYLVTSSFEYLPGLPVYRSADLVDWEHIGNVATREPQIGVADVPAGLGVWAPTIRHRDGKFHVIVTVNSGRGCVLFTAEDPAGAWSDGLPLGIDGIDPDLAWDVDGTAYVTYAGPSGIEQARVDLERGAVLEPPRRLWSGTGLQYPEAPHLYRRDDTWYLLIAEGGTDRGHAVSVARGRSIEGPFEGDPTNPVLSARSTKREVQSTGHADLVTAPDGTDVLVLLGVRAIGAYPGYSPLGRETFVTPVEWVDGWPRPAPVALDPRKGTEEQRWELTDPAVLDDPGWLAVRRTPHEVATPSTGRLTLAGVDGGLDARRPAFLGRRQRHHASRTSTTVDASGGAGGLALRWDDRCYLTLEARGHGRRHHGDRAGGAVRSPASLDGRTARGRGRARDRNRAARPGLAGRRRHDPAHGRLNGARRARRPLLVRRGRHLLHRAGDRPARERGCGDVRAL
jgi:beta-xylosidase